MSQHERTYVIPFFTCQIFEYFVFSFVSDHSVRTEETVIYSDFT